MKTTSNQVIGIETVEDKEVRRVQKYLVFKTEWWEKVSSTHLHNDICISTDRPIRAVWINGREILVEDK